MTKLLLSTMAAATLLANDAELETLKTQLLQMKQTINAMQTKIDTLEKSDTDHHESDQVSSATIDPVHAHHKTDPSLNLALFIDGSYVARSKKDEQLGHTELPGIAHSPYGDDGHGHGTYNAKNGFNLNYVELLLGTAITPNIDVKTLLHFSEAGVEIEEAYFKAKDLPYNVELKGGKFLSSFGYLNRQHHHQWDFSDLPLVYEAFLGTEGLNEIGAQLQWNAPIKPRLTFGVEGLQGKNEAMFGHASIQNPYSDDLLSKSAAQPSLIVAYAKTAIDIGNTQIRSGLSMAHGNTRQNRFGGEESYALNGKSDLYGIDFVMRHHLGNEKSLTWQSEWLSRTIKGTQFTEDGTAVNSAPLNKKQSGYYTQLVYAHDDNWRVGTRYDSIYQNRVIDGGINQNLPETMNQFSAMIDYTSNEIARYRLQYTRSNAFFNEDLVRQDFNTLLFSVNFTLGHHTHYPF